jgi:hypothetical protein
MRYGQIVSACAITAIALMNSQNQWQPATIQPIGRGRSHRLLEQEAGLRLVSAICYALLAEQRAWIGKPITLHRRAADRGLPTELNVKHFSGYLIGATNAMAGYEN